MHEATAAPGWLLVALCVLSGAYCLRRLRAESAQDRVGAGGEALMGFGMAAMAALPAAGRWADSGGRLLGTVFVGAAVHALWAARRGGQHHVHHLVGSLAMVYMAAGMVPGGGHRGHDGAGGVPVVTGLLLLYYTVYVLHGGTRLVPAALSPEAGLPATPGRAAVGGAWAARREVTEACRLAMGFGMLAMLLGM
ncbi:DUF5134 domain-containing protein [Streptomyces sp. NPDC093225]|uniref:DUF5134 domain-containing protein n=1 Tax=Streptomyces sp. NPDC093225 TaxID=3366034 RepID=UPI0037F7A874